MKAAFSKATLEAEMSSRFGPVIKPRERSTLELLPTGIVEVDASIGGLPRGGITEIFGCASSGRTTFTLAALTAATNREEACAWVDTNDTFHPLSAAMSGARLDHLLWIRCGSKLEHAFKATDLLLQGGGFSFVLLDLGDVPSGAARRIISSWWYRFRRVIENTSTAFVVLASDSCVRSCAAMTLKLKRSSAVWSITKLSDASHTSRLPELRFKLNSYKVCSTIEHSHVAGSYLPHSNLLVETNLLLQRQKPIHVGNMSVRFKAQNS
jgi:hypothetical protein